MYGLTTCHGTVLCFDRERRRVGHRPPRQVDPADLVLVSGLDRAAFGVIQPGGAWLEVDVGTPGPSRATAVRPAIAAVADGLATFRFEGGFFGAPPDDTVRMDCADALDWERFGLVEPDALTDILHLVRNDWIRVATGERIEAGAIGLADQKTVRIGPHSYPIADNFPRVGGPPGHGRHILFREGWMVEEFRLFRPLVFFVLMGGAPPYLEQFRLATESLLAFGCYERDVLVITDRNHDVVRALMPPALHGRLSFLDVQSSDKVDAVLARLMLAEHADAAGHAPILYSDTDVVFDRDLMPLLEDVLISGRMSAQSEPWNRLPESESCGAQLFAPDPIPFRHPEGFNAGIWAMPGGPGSVQVVDTIRRAVSRYLQRHGRESLPWLDQAMANYVLRKLDAFDPTLVDRTARLCQSGERLDPNDATGFVHFWPVSQRPDERAAAMAAYVESLHAAQDAR